MKALIVDDERLARLELRRLLAAHPEIAIVGEARNAEEALAQLTALEPDLLFLDIQMPGMNGFELLEKIEGDVPRVIFTTAYDEYAVRAFEVNALDYLLKPIAHERLARALARIPAERPSRVFVRDGDRCWIVEWSGIFLLESERQLHAPVFRRTSPADPPLSGRTRAAARSDIVLSRQPKTDSQLRINRPDGDHRQRTPDSKPARRSTCRDLPTSVGATALEAQALRCLPTQSSPGYATTYRPPTIAGGWLGRVQQGSDVGRQQTFRQAARRQTSVDVGDDQPLRVRCHRLSLGTQKSSKSRSDLIYPKALKHTCSARRISAQPLAVMHNSSR